jgi:hypothetical protein
MTDGFNRIKWIGKNLDKLIIDMLHKYIEAIIDVINVNSRVLSWALLS